MKTLMVAFSPYTVSSGVYTLNHPLGKLLPSLSSAAWLIASLPNEDLVIAISIWPVSFIISSVEILDKFSGREVFIVVNSVMIYKPPSCLTNYYQF